MEAVHLAGLSVSELEALGPLAAGLPLEDAINAMRDTHRAAALAADRARIDEIVSSITEERPGWTATWQHLEDICERDDSGSRYLADAALESLVASRNLNGYALCGYVLRYGKGGRTRDYARAFSLFSRAARGGHAVAMYHLGECYQHGLGTEADVFQAMHWYQRSVDLCCLEAFAALATLLQQGHGGAQSATQLAELHWHLTTAFEKFEVTHPGGRGLRPEAHRLLSAYMARYGAKVPEAQR